MSAEYDDAAAIGKRYRRQDEIGTPWALTIDEQTLADGTITLRDRDTLAAGAHPARGREAAAARQARAAVAPAHLSWRRRHSTRRRSWNRARRSPVRDLWVWAPDGPRHGELPDGLTCCIRTCARRCPGSTSSRSNGRIPEDARRARARRGGRPRRRVDVGRRLAVDRLRPGIGAYGDVSLATRSCRSSTSTTRRTTRAACRASRPAATARSSNALRGPISSARSPLTRPMRCSR